MLHKNTIFKFSIVQILSPVQLAYWPTYGPEKDIHKDHTVVLNELYNNIVKILTQHKDVNQEIEQRYVKELKQPKQIKHNIEYNLNIEWGLLESLLRIRKQMDENNLSFSVVGQQEYAQQDWKLSGYLEVYGLQPYRHMNHYISDYTFKNNEDKVEFTPKPQTDVDIKSSKTLDTLAKPMLDQLQQDKNKASGIFGRVYGLAKKVNRLVAPQPEQEDTKGKVLAWKQKLQTPTKPNRILVRDYELDFRGQLLLQNKEGLYLQGEQWVGSEDLKQSRNKIQLRTEAWIESKESDVTARGKQQVAVDFNYIMRGNPWVWVKRFDVDESN